MFRIFVLKTFISLKELHPPHCLYRFFFWLALIMRLLWAMYTHQHVYPLIHKPSYFRLETCRSDVCTPNDGLPAAHSSYNQKVQCCTQLLLSLKERVYKMASLYLNWLQGIHRVFFFFQSSYLSDISFLWRLVLTKVRENWFTIIDLKDTYYLFEVPPKCRTLFSFTS